eukprot:scaffold260_cov274-Pinguiococcus_pyrenoidosus.AAC.19
MRVLLGLLLTASAGASVREAAVSATGEILGAGVKPRARIQTYVLEHAIGTPDFTARGQIQVETESGETRKVCICVTTATKASEPSSYNVSVWLADHHRR